LPKDEDSGLEHPNWDGGARSEQARLTAAKLIEDQAADLSVP
jgi:hypothetical protein